MLARFLLPTHVYVRRTEDGAIFLDLEKDKYFAIGAREVACLDAGGTDAESVASELQGAGLLVQENGKPAIAVELPVPTSRLQITLGMEARRLVRWLDVLRFTAALVKATYKLKCRSLSYAARSVSKRKAKAIQRGHRWDEHRARRAAEIYVFLRAFAFTATDKCLFDSLVLVEFLATYGQFADWVIGVHTGPFEAHSWVQKDAFVLNGPAEYVRTYAPIAAF
jgi:hypothetical protein